MKKKIINLSIFIITLVIINILNTLFPILLYSQDVNINALEFITDYNKNLMRAERDANSWVGKYISLNGTLTGFGNSKDNVYLVFENDGRNAVVCQMKIQDPEFIYKISNGDKFSILGNLKKYGNMDFHSGMINLGFLIDVEKVISNGMVLFEKDIKKTEYNENRESAGYSYYLTGDYLANLLAYNKKAVNNYIGKEVKFTGIVQLKKDEFISFAHTSDFPQIATVKVVAEFDGYLSDEQSSNVQWGKQCTITGTFEKGESYGVMDIVTNPKYCDYIIKNARFSAITENDKTTLVKKNVTDGQENIQKEEPIFETFYDSKDSAQYKFIKIGNLYWMAENYKSNVKGSKCYDNTVKCEKYGRLYSIESAIKNAPYGWKLPTLKDWENLISYFGGKKLAYEKLIIGGSSGLNFSLGGYIVPSGDYQDVGINGIYWTSDKDYSGIISSKTIYQTFNSSEKEVHYNKFNDLMANVRYVIEIK